MHTHTHIAGCLRLIDLIYLLTIGRVFLNGHHENVIFVVHFQELDYMHMFGLNLREMMNVSFGKLNSFNNIRNDVTFGLHLVVSMLNTLQTLELVMVSLLFKATCKH